MDFGKDALHLLEVGLAAAVEFHAAAAALEQRNFEVLLQHADAMGDRGRRHPELGRGAGEALVSGGGLEEAQAFERGQEQHGSGTSGQALAKWCFGISTSSRGPVAQLPQAAHALSTPKHQLHQHKSSHISALDGKPFASPEPNGVEPLDN